MTGALGLRQVPRLGRMTAFGAERKHVTLLTDFRSPPENGHSRYCHLTARFAPEQSSTTATTTGAAV
jgi:hypothetical protein